MAKTKAKDEEIGQASGPQPEALNLELAASVREELGDERLVAMLREMLLMRRFEEYAGRAYQRRKIKGFCHLYIGQEAVGVGCMSALSDADKIVSHYREHGHALARGLDPNAVMAELYGKATGTTGGKGGSMHLFDASKGFLGGWGIVGGQISLAGGVAFALKYRGEKAACITFLGDGAVHQGIVHETLNMASLWDLPLITVVENNRYAMGTSIERVAAVTELAQKSAPYNIVGETVDGQDIFAVYDAIRRARKRAIEEGRPTWLDVLTYRYRGHSMTDPAPYRTKEEVEEEQDLRDPITRMSGWMVSEGILTEEQISAIDDEVTQQSKDAMTFAEESDFPDPAVLTEDVYVEWPWDIE
ncbi:pyruvate dehydrogenase (acetyl-transferring) E1 component subunit alpha [Lujinxingia litoralis]|nr:pyruvate dehydrogenase (acetyl-transferring) E1 component subunit alpha [Lujinxingia litoralis]